MKHTTTNTLLANLTLLADLGPDIHVFVVTGGPCSGKTTGLARLASALGDRGYKVLISPESATRLIVGGIHPWEIGAAVFQRQILLDTLAQEERFLEAARAYRDLGKKVVILCDRGAMDGQAYVAPAEFEALVKSVGLTLPEICERRYHAVFHLRTAAIGAEEHYTLENNAARMETAEEARELDERTLRAWQRHHHPRVVDNSTPFAEKIGRLLAEVCAALGDPAPVERERKYLIELPDLASLPVFSTTSRITQDYLVGGSAEGGEPRVRVRDDGTGPTYTHTVKRALGPGERIEIERMVDQDEYWGLIEMKAPGFRTIVKRRTCFFHEGQFVEVDVFESPREIAGLAVMEIEQLDLERTPNLPPFIRVVRDVTGDPRYLNRALAKGDVA
jgi:CYTH domain-containing protein/predicted ATPase